MRNTVCIKDQIKMTFVVPQGRGGPAGGGGTFRGLMKTFCPFPQPATVHPFIRTLEGRGASAGHSGIPIGT